VNGEEEGKSQELVIIRRRGGEGDDKHHGGVWKIAYADFMTAMMAFFLVMWLINSTDKKTLTQVATYFNPMRLTDKRPTPKGLQEPDGSEGKDAVTQKGGKKKEQGEGKGSKKADETESGEVRPHGKPFDRKVEDVDKKVPNAQGATTGESPRQSGGRAFRDPFDSAQRTEIVPAVPAAPRAEPAAPRVAAPTPADAQGRVLLEVKRGDTAEPRTPANADAKGNEAGGPAPGAGAGETKRADLVSPMPLNAGEGKRAEPVTPAPAAAAGATRPEPTVPPQPGTSDTKAGEQVMPTPAAGVDARRPQRGEPAPVAPGEAKVTTPAADKAAAEKAAAAERAATDRVDAERLEGSIRQALAEALPGILPHVDVTVTPEGVLISLTDDFDFGMFAIGSAEPRPATHIVMDKVGKILQTRTETLVVRGHTDSRKYRTVAYDNWRLSAARAHVAYTMLARSGVEESRFERIEGHADRSPRVPSDTEAAQNRRIEILLRRPQP
jgi:chemotaxis protein MotB